MKIIICSLIKDEQQYLDEWIQHHLSIGVSKIYLIEDDFSTSHEYITQKYENVFLKQRKDYNDIFFTPHRQQNTFMNFQKKHFNTCDWCGFIDIDEFIFFENGYNFDKLLAPFNDKTAVHLKWKMFGADGNITKQDKKVIDTFKCEKQNLNNKFIFKFFINMRNEKAIIKNVHKVYFGVTTNGKTHIKDGNYNKAWINHYFTKSWEEYKEKLLIRGDVVKGNRKIEQFFIINDDMLSLKEKLLNELDNEKGNMCNNKE